MTTYANSFVVLWWCNMAHTFLVPHKIITGRQALIDASTTLSTLGKKALIVSDHVMVSLGNVDILTDALDKLHITYSIFDEINTEPNNDMITLGVQAYRQHNCDFIIALGGGSPIDSMKAIAMMLDEDASISSFMGVILDKKLPPMVAIPTTAGTGSEATMFTIITDVKSKVKMLLKGACLIPDVAIIDPQFSMSSPKAITSTTGIDALCHAIEAYTSRKAQPLSDTFALSAIKRIFKYLLTAYEEPNNEIARSQMSLAALEAGIAFNNASVTIVHGMSRPIGALFHISHGLSNAMLLEGCMNYVVDSAYERFAEISQACAFSSSDDPIICTQALLDQLSLLLKQLHIPTMQEAGISSDAYYDAIEKMSKDAMESGSPSNTIKTIEESDILHLYHTIYK